jgi:hypothetical protein
LISEGEALHNARMSKRSYPQPIADLAGGILDPVLRRRTGMSVALVQSWEEIVGPRLAATSRPEKLHWPNRPDGDDAFRPATLVVACEGLAALHLQHETGEVIARLNDFLGFAAVERIRIVQKPVAAPAAPQRRRPRPLSSSEAGKVEATTAGIDDEPLREALRRLGASVLGSGDAKK